MKIGTRLIVLASVLGVATVAAPAEEEEKDPKASDPNMAEVVLELPEASQGGTPMNYWSANLDIGFKPRPKLYAPKGVVMLSKGKLVTSSDSTASKEELARITDGKKGFAEEYIVLLKPGLHYVQVDLGKTHALHAVAFWHFFESERVYFDVIVQVSNDSKFKEGVTTLLHNDHDKSVPPELGKDRKERDKEYIDKTTGEGKLVDAEGIKARYVRLYSQGNSTDDTNDYIEVEVFGKPVAEGS